MSDAVNGVVTAARAPEAAAAGDQKVAERKAEDLAVSERTETRGEQEQSDLDVQQVVSHLNDFVQNVRRELQFSIDEDSGRTIIKVIDAESDEVIREIPPEEVTNIAKRLEEGSGLILQAEV